MLETPYCDAVPASIGWPSSTSFAGPSRKLWWNWMMPVSSAIGASPAASSGRKISRSGTSQEQRAERRHVGRGAPAPRQPRRPARERTRRSPRRRARPASRRRADRAEVGEAQQRDRSASAAAPSRHGRGASARARAGRAARVREPARPRADHQATADGEHDVRRRRAQRAGEPQLDRDGESPAPPPAARAHGQRAARSARRRSPPRRRASEQGSGRITANASR